MVINLDAGHKMVEISDESGVALDFVTVPIEKLRLVAKYSD